MDVFNSVQGMLDRGVSAAKGAVSGVAVENQAFMRGFARLCNDGWLQGWHERNGGNLSYRMTEAEVEACRAFFYDTPSSWVNMGVHADNLRSAYFATTGAGCYLRNVQQEPSRNVGIVQVNDAGDSWRIVWGFSGGSRPTSEFASHFLNHSARMAATGGACRVMYHAHPDYAIALTKVLPPDARAFSRALWKATTESVIAFPAGVGVTDCLVPGSMELARATSELMCEFEAVIWAQHGVFASGADFDAAFGLMHAVEKAAHVHVEARLLNGGSDDFPHTISDDTLRSIARELKLPLRESFLE